MQECEFRNDNSQRFCGLFRNPDVIPKKCDMRVDRLMPVTNTPLKVEGSHLIWRSGPLRVLRCLTQSEQRAFSRSGFYRTRFGRYMHHKGLQYGVDMIAHEKEQNKNYNGDSFTCISNTYDPDAPAAAAQYRKSASQGRDQQVS